MEKLIELLNAYQQDFRYQDESDVDYREARIISKSYWFIKRLVENDKIDLNKFPQIMEYSDYESLLMILAIKDNQIEFLCSILK